MDGEVGFTDLSNPESVIRKKSFEVFVKNTSVYQVSKMNTLTIVGKILRVCMTVCQVVFLLLKNKGIRYILARLIPFENL